MKHGRAEHRHKENCNPGIWKEGKNILSAFQKQKHIAAFLYSRSDKTLRTFLNILCKQAQIGAGLDSLFSASIKFLCFYFNFP